MGQENNDKNNNADKLAIHNQENFARAIVDASPDILFVMNINTKEILYTSSAIERILGYSKKQVKLMKQPLFDMMFAEDVPKINAHLEAMKAAKDGEILEIEYRLNHSDGTLRWFTDRNAVFKRDEQGLPVLQIGIAHDITAEKEAKDEIISLNRKLVAKTRELESVHSELRTFNSIAANDYQENLRTLYTNLEFIISTEVKNLSDTGKGNVRKAQTAIQKMKLLTDDLVDFSKIPLMESKRSYANLNEILIAVLADIDAKVKDSRISVESDNLPIIHGFPLLLSLLFYHLLDNAVKFRSAGSKPVINIGYEEIDGSNLIYGMQADFKYHCITFKDNGIGFDPNEAESVFSIFYRLHERGYYKGSGIGLAACRKIMDLHNGFIAARSLPGKGSSFCCFFPIEDLK